jgi:hypothetical protein
VTEALKDIQKSLAICGGSEPEERRQNSLKSLNHHCTKENMLTANSFSGKETN